MSSEPPAPPSNPPIVDWNPTGPEPERIVIAGDNPIVVAPYIPSWMPIETGGWAGPPGGGVTPEPEPPGTGENGEENGEEEPEPTAAGARTAARPRARRPKREG